MAVELGAAYISILPSTTKLATAVASEFGKIEGDAKSTGAKIGSALAGGVKPIDVKINTPSIPTPDAPDIPDADTGSFGSSLKSAMGPIGAIAGGVLGVAIIGGLKAAMDREASTDLLAAQLGLGPKEAARLGRIAGDLYVGNYAESVTVGNEALRDILTFIPGMEDASAAKLEGFAANLLSQASITGEDPRRIAQIVGQMMKTGLADSAAGAMDIITTGFQEGLNKDDDWLDTLNEYGIQFEKVGLSGPDALALISQAMQAGARDSDIAADAIKEFSIRAVDGSDLTRQSFRDLGLDAEDMAAKIAAGGPSARAGLDTVLDKLRQVKDPMDKARISVGLFGTQSEDMGKALGKMDLSKPRGELGKFKGSADRATEALGDNALGDLTTFYRGIKTKVVDVIVAVALPALKDLTRFLADKVGPAIDRAVDFAKKGKWQQAWNELKPIVREVWEWIKEHIVIWGQKLEPLAEAIGEKIGEALASGIMNKLDEKVPDWVWSSEGVPDKTVVPDDWEEGDAIPGATGSLPDSLNTPSSNPYGTTNDNRTIIHTQNVHNPRVERRRRQGDSRRSEPLGVG